MARTNYGRVGANRRGGGAWQWLVIGLVVGLGCSAVLVLSLLTLGVLEIASSGDTQEVAVLPTDIPLPSPDVQATVNMVVASTLASIAAQPPQQQQPVETPTQQQESQIIVPSPTPPTFTTPTDAVQPTVEQQQQAAPSATTADLQLPTTNAGDALNTAGTGSEIPPELAGIISSTVPIPAGTFRMGTDPTEVARAVTECVQRDGGACQAEYGLDSYPAHAVTLNAYEMEITEVTNAQYVAFLNSMGPGSHARGCFNAPCVNVSPTDANSLIVFDSLNYDVGPTVSNLPVVGVTWFGARAYCEAIGRRLPTEAEWERAARGDDGNIYPWGNDWNNTFARTDRFEGGGVGVVEVRSIAQNVSPFGVFDMAGNAAEWVYDWYGANYYGQPDATGLNPQGPASGTERAVRGGSWDTPPFFARSVHRQSFPPTDTYLWLGFRCADDFNEQSALATANPNAGALGSLDTLSTIAPEPTQGEAGAAPTQRALPQLPLTPTLELSAAPPNPPGEG
ncbi:MAG: hypothetical protein OHK0046_14150 [Anaerolineae bacterium]